MGKAQIHMMETVFVVLIVFILIGIGLVFFVSQQRTALLEKQREFQNLEMIKKTQILSFLPELQCSFDGVIDTNCYDIIKVMQFQDIISADRFYYNSLLGNLKIVIARFDPSPGKNRYEWYYTIYDNPKKEDKGYRLMTFPIQLYNATQNSYYFGMMNVSIYR